METCLVNQLMFHPYTRSNAPLQSTWRIIGFFTQSPVSSKTPIENNIICATLQVAINSSSAMLSDKIPCILLMWAIGALFKITCRPPHHLHEFSSIVLPKSEIPLIWNSYFLPPSQTPSGCIINPLLGMHSTCCMTHSPGFV